ncbi:MAG: hypothetical protein IPJ20_19640 [Flammeovirgaceae bacterium]|nr:hypothetical protein [Flammeovirgaceae bacterium]
MEKKIYLFVNRSLGMIDPDTLNQFTKKSKDVAAWGFFFHTGQINPSAKKIIQGQNVQIVNGETLMDFILYKQEPQLQW